MIDFFGLRKMLSSGDKLWKDEKTHNSVIKKLKTLVSYNLPKNIFEEVFPFGWNSPEMRGLKEELSARIQKNHPLPNGNLEEFSEEQMREYIRNAASAFQNQFEECLERLYSIDKSGPEFNEIKEEFCKKYKAILVIEIIMGILVLLWMMVVIFGIPTTLLVNNFRLPNAMLMVMIIPILALSIGSTITIRFCSHYFTICGIKPNLYQ